jgi:hypothetical protein
VTDEQYLAKAREIAADIARELRTSPGRWGQGWFWIDADGAHVRTAEEGVCFCLAGMIHARLGTENQALTTSVFDVFEANLPSDDVNIATWNDTPGRTPEDVIELCEKVATS